MHGIHPDTAGIDERAELAVRLEIDLVRQLETLVVRQVERGAMIEAARPLLRLGDQRAAERDVQFLEAAADGEERHAHLDRKRDQTHRRLVAREVVRLVALARLDAVARRMHVRARAGEHDAVDAREQRLEVEPSPRFGSINGTASTKTTALR